MEHLNLITTLSAGLSAALVLGYLALRLGLSPTVGYLLAGIAVGPNTPGFQADAGIASELAEVGVILLMFGVGLQFHVHELLAVRKVAVPGAAVQIASSWLMGCLVAKLFGWEWAAAAAYGLAVSVSSTVVLTRVLGDARQLHTPIGHHAIGWLVVQDVFAVLVLVVLKPLFQGGDSNVLVSLLIGVGKMLVLTALVMGVGGRAIPWMLTRLARTGSRELFTLAVLVVALGIAFGSTIFFGASPALGAFLAGLVVGQSEFSARAASDALPMRDAFAVLFFVSAGMLFEPASLIQHTGLIAMTLAVVLIGTPLVVATVVRLLGRPANMAISMGLALGQIGEFSFIIAAGGKAVGVLPKEAEPALVAVAIASIALNPIMYRLAGQLEKWVGHERPIATEAPAPLSAYTAVVVGYGPVGRTVVRLLRENGIEPTVVEMNLETIRRLKAEGIRAVYGDGAKHATMEEAGACYAMALFLTSSHLDAAEEAVRIARELNPQVKVFARAMYLRESKKLRDAGADAVFSGEGEVALSMTTYVLRQLGATPEQIDRERDRIRDELFEGPLAADQPPTPLPRTEEKG